MKMKRVRSTGTEVFSCMVASNDSCNAGIFQRRNNGCVNGVSGGKCNDGGMCKNEKYGFNLGEEGKQM